MEPSITIKSSISSARTSNQWTSARLGLSRTSIRVLGRMSSNGPRTVLARSSHQFLTTPFPPTIKVPSMLQLPVAKVNMSMQEVLWSSQSSVRSLVCTWCTADISLQILLRNPIAWLMNVTYKLQVILGKLFTSPQQSAQVQPARDGSSSSPNNVSSVSASTLITTSGAATLRSSSGCYMPGGSRRQINDVTATPTILMASQVPPAVIRQRSVSPVTGLAIASAAGLTLGSLLLFQRWRTMLEIRKQQAQRLALKKDSLARQKQRFQRALVVDSVNLELLPTKDIDLQPRPVKIEKIPPQGVTQQCDSASGNPTSGNLVPGLAGESLRQWQQFMAASRAKEVTNISGTRRGRDGAADQPAERPYVAMDDRMLADLSDRIRRANELPAVREAAPTPFITFEQLYANNQESDDEAMARRAAERKARWQKQQPVASTTKEGAARNYVAAWQLFLPSKPSGSSMVGTATGFSSKPRSKAVSPENPFAVGLFTDTLPTSSGQSTLAARGNSTAGSDIKAHGPDSTDSSARQESDFSSGRGDAAIAVRSDEVGTPRQGTINLPQPAAVSSAHFNESVPSHVDIDASFRNAEAMASPQNSFQDPFRGPVDMPEVNSYLPKTLSQPTKNAWMRVDTGYDTRKVDSGSASMTVMDVASAAAAGSSGCSPTSMVNNETVLCNPGSDDPLTGDEGSKQHRDDPVASPIRRRRSPATGQLRIPDIHEPALAKLMRRPGNASAASNEVKCRVPSQELLCNSESTVCGLALDHCACAKSCPTNTKA